MCAGLAWAGVVDRVAASVDDDVIALSEVYEIGAPYVAERCPAGEESCVYEMELEVLDALIKRVLIRSELDRLDMRVTGQDIDQAIDQVVRDNGLADRQALRAEVESQGMQWDTFRDDMADRMRLQRFQQAVLMPRVVVSEDEVRDIYKRTERGSRQPEVKIDAFGMVVPADAEDEGAAAVAEAEAIVAAIQAGELTWEDAVAEHDKAQLAKVVGGRTYQRGQLNEVVDEVAFTADVGAVTGPIRVGQILFVLKINDRGLGEARVVPFEEVADQLRNQVFQDKLVLAEEEWYQRARRLSAVEILIPKPGE